MITHARRALTVCDSHAATVAAAWLAVALSVSCAQADVGPPAKTASVEAALSGAGVEACSCCETVTPSAADAREAGAFAWILDTSPYPPRWYCGTWSAGIGWLHIASDVVIWLSYLAIPFILVYFTRRRAETPFKAVMLLFVAFIVSCGMTHLMEAVIFWWPAYGLAGVMKCVTALVSFATVIALLRVVPEALTYRSPPELEKEVQLRTSELELARRQAALVVEASPAPMVMIDSDGIATMINAAAERVFGFETGEMVGKSAASLLVAGGEERSPKNAWFEAGATDGTERHREFLGVKKCGEQFPVELALNKVPSEHGEATLAVIIDVTDRKRAEAQMQRAHDAAMRSNRDLEQFAYVASHDLQEPLRKISSYCEAVKDDFGHRLDAEGLEFLDVAINGARRLSSLVRDLLVFSRLATRGKPLKTTDAADCLQAAIENLEVVIEETAAVVTFDDLPNVVADDGQLVLLFQNLIGNAIKYRGDQPPLVHVAVQDCGPFVEISVSDNGIGIDPKFQQRIFQIFQRLHNRRDYEGNGIGLAFCKRIVERFGGRIWVESSPGNGSTFTFTIQQAVSAKGGRHVGAISTS